MNPHADEIIDNICEFLQAQKGNCAIISWQLGVGSGNSVCRKEEFKAHSVMIHFYHKEEE
jgi:hypothetical protein